jgi:hypothetical protein
VRSPIQRWNGVTGGQRPSPRPAAGKRSDGLRRRSGGIPRRARIWVNLIKPGPVLGFFVGDACVARVQRGFKSALTMRRAGYLFTPSQDVPKIREIFPASIAPGAVAGFFPGYWAKGRQIVPTLGGVRFFAATPVKSADRGLNRWLVKRHPPTSERVAIAEAVAERLKVQAEHRMKAGKAPCGNISTGSDEAGKTRDLAAAGSPPDEPPLLRTMRASASGPPFATCP